MANGNGAAVRPPTAAATRPARAVSSRFSWARGLSRDAAIKISLTAGLVLLTSVLVVRQRLEFPPADLVKPLGFLSALVGAAAYYRRRGEARFVLCLVSLAQVLAFVACYTVLMYVTATAASPLADGPLAAFDAACGLEVPAVRAWAGAHPFAEILLGLAYDTLLYQLALIVIILGLLGDQRPLESFVVQFALGALLTLVVFRFLPAEGPFSAYGFEPSASQARYLEHLRALRSGERRLVSFEGAEGLITFPSFHVTWAMLLTLGYRHRRWLFVPFAVLNTLVVASTMTTGWHYFADVLGGLAVGFASWGAAAAMGRWIYAGGERSEVRG
ncbi:MAG TPA: phosphatase PAP2 family protein [Pirellulales bacterium]|jgi:membrane-associated phospholipid phosphatase|nr:phosphatase PAP2 family protein [Pirellulales bacterium]